MTTELHTKSVQTVAITVEAAAALIKAARVASQSIGFESAIAVTDAAGNLKAFERTDRCPFLAADVAIDKAWTAAAFGLTTHTWAAVIENPKVAQLAHRPRLVAVGGGYPIIESGQVIGAIGSPAEMRSRTSRRQRLRSKKPGFDVPA